MAFSMAKMKGIAGGAVKGFADDKGKAAGNDTGDSKPLASIAGNLEKRIPKKRDLGK